MPKEGGIQVVSDEEDGEDKMWEEEQVTKGLGKRLDDGVGTQGMSGNVNGVSSIQQGSNLQPSYGFSGAVTGHHLGQNVEGSSLYGSVGGSGVDMLSVGEMSFSLQAELAKKALNDNLKRAQESDTRTMVSLTKTEENLSSSLLNVASLERSLFAAGEKFLFMQKLREFVSVYVSFCSIELLL